MKNYFVTFFVAYPYYLPNILPIIKELKKRDLRTLLIFSNKNIQNYIFDFINRLEIDYLKGEEKLSTIDSKIIYLLNGHDKKGLKAPIVYMGHGVGGKKCAHEQMANIADTIFVEGDYRYNNFIKQFPQYKNKLFKVGFSKMDEIYNISKDKKDILEKYNLSPNKKTILYAPTFFPSSIEKMSDNFPKDFENYNIIIKAHYLSLNRKKYKKHQEKFKKWNRYKNVFLAPQEEFNIAPFMAISDLMISDESSVVFEFASINKPVVINRFLKLRLSYYLFPKKLKNRMDEGVEKYKNIGPNPKSYKDMVKDVNDLLQSNKNKYDNFRQKYCDAIIGNVDGNVSKRIVEILIKKYM